MGAKQSSRSPCTLQARRTHGGQNHGGSFHGRRGGGAGRVRTHDAVRVEHLVVLEDHAREVLEVHLDRDSCGESVY